MLLKFAGTECFHLVRKIKTLQRNTQGRHVEKYRGTIALSVLLVAQIGLLVAQIGWLKYDISGLRAEIADLRETVAHLGGRVARIEGTLFRADQSPSPPAPKKSS